MAALDYPMDKRLMRIYGHLLAAEKALAEFGADGYKTEWLQEADRMTEINVDALDVFKLKCEMALEAWEATGSAIVHVKQALGVDLWDRLNAIKSPVKSEDDDGRTD